jgi:hypothetical protein
VGEQLGHRPQRKAAEVLVQPGRDDPRPSSASRSAALTTDVSKNCTSSIPTTSEPLARAASSATPRTGTARIRSPACETTAVASKRSSITGLKMTTRCPVISARRSRRIISSLLPENIGPQMTSSQPPRLSGIRIIAARDHRKVRGRRLS